jgi:GDPmannose 4,6-dehydratase
MWMMLQHDVADDYIVGTGETHSVRDFVEQAFAIVDLDWKKFVKSDPAFDRPAEPAQLVGNADKIRKTLGWKPTGSFEQLVREMVEAEMKIL